jgi:hypothetical protein
MGPSDAPLNFDPPKVQDVQYVHAAWQSFENLLAGSTKVKQGLDAVSKDSKEPGETITDRGQIKSMTLPSGWEEGPSTSGGIGTRSFREVHPSEFPDAKLCFYYRGLPASEKAGENFKAILDKPAHILTGAEISSIGEILRGKDDKATFSPLMIKTEDVNGKRVLTVNGRLNERQDDLKEILVNADGTGRVVQEIYFQAPKELYTRYMKDAQNAMNTIEWK